MMRHEAIRNIYPNVVTIVKDTIAYDASGNIVTLNEDLISAEMIKLKTAYDAKQYQRDRFYEYPLIEDQLDYIYHNGVTKWKTDMITPVKEKYPKPD